MWREFERFPKAKPRAVKGGIKAQSRGQFGVTWWAKRWIAVLESFNLGARLARGRTYARKGQVMAITFTGDTVTAKVQGSDPKPYAVSIAVTQLGAKDWAKVVAALNTQAVFASKLLNGEMPHEIESVFKEAGVSLFPEKLGDLRTSCSCPDWSNPCKHVAAVYYLLGEEFDRDPFLLFQLRGFDRSALTKALLGRAKENPTATPATAPSEPLSADLHAFWGTPLPADLVGPLAETPVTAGVLRRLGKFPFWRGEESLVVLLTPRYEQARPAARQAYLGAD